MFVYFIGYLALGILRSENIMVFGRSKKTVRFWVFFPSAAPR